MDEGNASETLPDLRDIEVKIGRKAPEGLLRWMREEASSLRGDARLGAPNDSGREIGKKSLDEKIRKLRVEMAHLRSVDVKILQQLLAVHEGIEAVKWLMEERSTLTSRCSSLTSSQYSLGDTSWRGSWSSLQDPNDKLDNISIGSYLDTLADDMDEYCPSSSESVICSTTPLVSESTAGGRTGGGPGATVTAGGTEGAGEGVRSDIVSRSEVRAGMNEKVNVVENGTEMKGEEGTGVASAITGTGTRKPATPVSSPRTKSEMPKQDDQVWIKTVEMGKGSPVSKGKSQTNAIKVNGIVEKPTMQADNPTGPSLTKKLGTSQSPKHKTYKKGKIDLDTCKMNGKMHLEYDAHWRWVQSQEDVTFL